jgi:hypothetical protein
MDGDPFNPNISSKLFWSGVARSELRLFEHNQIYDSMITLLPVATQTRYNQALAEGTRREVRQVTDNAFQVSDSKAETFRTGDRDVRKCSCGQISSIAISMLACRCCN